MQIKCQSRRSGDLDDVNIAVFFSAYAALVWSAGQLLDEDNGIIAELNTPSAKAEGVEPKL
jgi:hypothetical protein